MKLSRRSSPPTPLAERTNSGGGRSRPRREGHSQVGLLEAGFQAANFVQSALGQGDGPASAAGAKGLGWRDC